MRRTSADIAWWQKTIVVLIVIGYLSLLGLLVVIGVHFVVKYW